MKSQKKILFVWDGEFHPNPNLISSPTNQMSYQATMPTKPFHYLIIYVTSFSSISYYSKSEIDLKNLYV